MTLDPGPNVALYFDPDAYTEAHARSGAATGPAGLMGRQVAGKEFLDAYLTHGRWETLTGVVRSRDRMEPLLRLCQEHPSSRTRQRRLVSRVETDFVAAPVAPVLHYPCPPEARFAWARQSYGTRFALSGVTHTLSSAGAVQALCDLVTAPFEDYDALICTSKSVADMVRAVTGAYSDYLADRFGGTPGLRSRLEIFPLGVDPDRYRPPTDAERATERARIRATDDEVVALCVGRLSHHAKAHPFPVFHAAEQAARATGVKVHLVFAGWAAHPAIDRAFRDGARLFAPSVRVSFVDGLDPAIRSGVWRAADIFVSLPDNIQETFGLVVVEAMASGLPVVGSDWNGYRDLVVDGETGFLVPTHMLQGATLDTTTRLMFGHVKYDHFLAECSQATIVEPEAAALALTRLVGDAPLRRRMGAAGRERARRLFSWQRVIGLYEALWADQERAVVAAQPPVRRLAMYPAPETSFAGYPMAWWDDSHLVQAAPDAAARLPMILELPLTNLVGDRRCVDRTMLAGLLDSAVPSRRLGELRTDLEQGGVADSAARATLAWLLKYDLLQAVAPKTPDRREMP
jgi:glycosyltransferase involved in cell wall biosynthesis